MLKLCKITKVNVFFLVLACVFNFDFNEFSAAILEKGLFVKHLKRKQTKQKSQQNYL